MSVIPNAEATTLHEFLVTNAEPGSTVVTDGWSAYPKACRDWFEHEPRLVAGSGKQANELLPAVHRVAGFPDLTNQQHQTSARSASAPWPRIRSSGAQ